MTLEINLQDMTAKQIKIVEAVNAQQLLSNVKPLSCHNGTLLKN